MTWGTWGKNLADNEIIALLNCFLENGITTFDHADIYGAHTTEEAFGNAFSKSGIKYVSENRNYNIKHYDYSLEHIMWSVDNSLKKLKTEYLDVFLLHRPSPLMQPEVIAEAVDNLRNKGKIRSFGVSNFTQNQIASKEL